MNLQENIHRIKEIISFLNEEKCINCDKRTLGIIQNLNPQLQSLAKKFVDQVKKELGLDLVIVDGLRSNEQQDKLYCQGRPSDQFCKLKNLPTAGSIVTHKKGGEGKHNYGNAFDVYFKKNGQIDLKNPITPEVANIGKKLGLEWGGDWETFKDFPHFELGE